MKFSAVLIAAAALVCASVNAEVPNSIGAVKGVPLVFDAQTSLRSAQFTKGEALIHSRSENLATSNVAVPDATNPYMKSKEVGVVGVAFSATNETESETDSSSAWTIGLAVGGCAVAAVGIAGFVLMKKRTQEPIEGVDAEAQTPASGSPSNEVVDFKNDMETPVAV